jgi:nucleotide-binding universal stress UspA family protein
MATPGVGRSVGHESPDKEPVMTTILVAFDDSERALDALAFAHQTAVASGASVLVANVFPYDDHPSRMSNLGYRRILEADALKLVREAAASLADLGEDRVRTAVVARHSPAHGLHDLAESERPDLIVTGSSHVGHAGRVAPGSTGERLLHGASCPVAIVPKGFREGDNAFRTIGVAYDASPEAEVALRAGTDVARATGASLRVIRVMDAVTFGSPAMMGGPGYVVMREDIEKRLRDGLDEAMRRLPEGVNAEAVFLSGDPAHELAGQTGTLDLLITGSRGYGPLRAVMTGGVTGRVLRDAACPVVVLPRGVQAPLGTLFAHGAGAAA